MVGLQDATMNEIINELERRASLTSWDNILVKEIPKGHELLMTIDGRFAGSHMTRKNVMKLFLLRVQE